jgi:GNAT superfamily N-acetyltransferase
MVAMYSGAPVSLTIRPGTKADRDLMVVFHHALYVDHREEILSPEIAPLYAYENLGRALREDVDALLSSPRSLIFIAETTDRPVGYITGHVEEDARRVLARKGVVEDWYVEPDARGTGIGRTLFDALVASFRDRGCVVLESTTWAGNDSARKAHRALGFHDIEIKMRREL